MSSGRESAFQKSAASKAETVITRERNTIAVSRRYLKPGCLIYRADRSAQQYKQNARGRDVNKAGYTSTLVACGWAEAVLEVTRASGRSLKLKKLKKQPTDRLTN